MGLVTQGGMTSTSKAPSVHCIYKELVFTNPRNNPCSHIAEHIHRSAPSCPPQKWVKTYTAPLLWATDRPWADRKQDPSLPVSPQYIRRSCWGPSSRSQIMNAFSNLSWVGPFERAGFKQLVKNRVEIPQFRHRQGAGWWGFTGVIGGAPPTPFLLLKDITLSFSLLSAFSPSPWKMSVLPEFWLLIKTVKSMGTGYWMLGLKSQLYCASVSSPVNQRSLIALTSERCWEESMT